MPEQRTTDPLFTDPAPCCRGDDGNQECWCGREERPLRAALRACAEEGGEALRETSCERPARFDRAIDCLGSPEYWAVRTYVEQLEARVAGLEGALRELRIRLHAAGRRPEECHEMSVIDDALAEGADSPREERRAETWRCTVCGRTNDAGADHCAQCDYSRYVTREGNLVPREERP